MKRLMVVIGTRPEVVKCAPVIKLLQNSSQFDLKVCVTAQHREMLDQMIDFFDIKVDYDLNCMQASQDLEILSNLIMERFSKLLFEVRPDFVFVQGDTTTVFIAALASYYQKIPVIHLEAGLRTHNFYSPFPEEMNRKIVSQLASFHLCPLKKNRQYLIDEGVCADTIEVVGNTVVDSLLMTKNKIDNDVFLKNKIETTLSSQGYNVHSLFTRKLGLITLHRRENVKGNLSQAADLIKSVALKYPEIDFLFPLHLNPKIQDFMTVSLKGIPNLFLLNPLAYDVFVYLLS